MAAQLITLAEAAIRYGNPAVNSRKLRTKIKQGELPAKKLGREYLVDVVDLDALLRPTLQEPRPRKRRESESARIARQLANAGIGT